MTTRRSRPFPVIGALLLGTWAVLLAAAQDVDRQPAARVEGDEYDFRESVEYKALSTEDRDRLERVHRDLTLLWGALDCYAYHHDGHSPESLSQLVPIYLRELPKDPFATEITTAAAPPGRFVSSLDGWGYRYLRGRRATWMIKSVGLPEFPYAGSGAGLSRTKGTWFAGTESIDVSDLVIPLK